jgi:thiol-disulfide isomerase/thioredoxin
MHLAKTSLTVLFLIFFNHFLFAQGKFNVTINLPSQLKLSNFEIYYDSGKKSQKIDSLKNHSIVISDSFFTKYAGITVRYKENESQRLKPGQSYFVHNKPATITFFLKPHQEFTFNSVKLKNAISALVLGQREMDQYTAIERKRYVDLVNSDKLYDSLVAVNEYSRKESMKLFEFIKKYPDKYYSLWCFRTTIAPSAYFDADSVAFVFKNIFDLNTQNSADGKIIRQIIRGRTSTKIGDTLSAFSIEDIDGKKFTIGSKGNEYQLLVFWGSWCPPCIAELPIIKEIGNKYGENKLKIFGIAIQDEIQKVRKVQDKYKVNWHIVLNDDNAPEILGISGTPETILIDNNGKIVYRSDETSDYGQLSILQEYLRKNL